MPRTMTEFLILSNNCKWSTLLYWYTLIYLSVMGYYANVYYKPFLREISVTYKCSSGQSTRVQLTIQIQSDYFEKQSQES